MKILRDTVAMLGQMLTEFAIFSICALVLIILLSLLASAAGNSAGAIPWMKIEQFSSKGCHDCTYKPENTILYTTHEPHTEQIQENRWRIIFKP